MESTDGRKAKNERESAIAGDALVRLLGGEAASVGSNAVGHGGNQEAAAASTSFCY